MNRRAWALSAATAAALVLSGCAASDGDAGDGGTITLMVIESMTGPTGVDQTAPKGAEAAASAINEAGGIDGQDIKIISCDTASDPNKATECARKAVSEKVAAVVGGFDPIGVSGTMPILESAKIPYILPVPTTPAEFSSPVSYPGTSGAPGGNFGMVAAAKDAGCTKVGTMGDTKADFGQTEAVVASLKAAGMDGYYVELPTGTADVTPAVAQLLDEDPDCFAYASNGQVGVQLFKAVRQAGSDAQFITSTGSLLPPFLKALGPDGEGIIAVQDDPSLDSPDLKPFMDDMAKYQPDVKPVTFTLHGWYGVQAFKQAAEGLDKVTAQTVGDALAELDGLELPGLAPIDFTGGTDSEVYPRMFNPTVQYAVVQGGKYVVEDPEWHPVDEYLP